jgi:hypothetical protein
MISLNPTDLLPGTYQQHSQRRSLLRRTQINLNARRNARTGPNTANRTATVSGVPSERRPTRSTAYHHLTLDGDVCGF